MLSETRARKRLILIFAASSLILTMLVGIKNSLAKKDGFSASSQTSNSPSGWGDDGVYEVGVEWMNIFPNPADNRKYWNISCDGMYNFLQIAGWTPRFHYTNYAAYEMDGKRSSLGGWENSFVDNVDLAMFCTHGSTAFDNTWQKDLSAVYFGSTHTDQYLSPGDAYLSYGDKDLEYLAFDSCSMLADPSLIYWASTFNGLHMLFGFSNSMSPDPFGDGWLWGFFTTLPSYNSTLTQGWFSAIDINQPSYVCARILGEDLNNYNERWWNTSPDPAVNSEKWVWDHCSHGIIYGLNNGEPSKTIAIPKLQVLQRNVDESYIRNSIAPAFEMSGDIINNNKFFYMVDNTNGYTLTLLIDSVTGSYLYQNQSKLWTVPVITPTLPTEREAGLIIYNWFNQTPAGNLPGAWYRNASFYYTPEGVYNLILSPGKNGELQGETTAYIPADISMTYPRTINVIAQADNGMEQANYPIFGPGARTVIYLGDQGVIIGAVGGSRDLGITGDMVEILDSNVVWSMYLANPQIAIGEIPFMADIISPTAPTLGYYEMPYYVHQNDLIPVWEFRSNFYYEGTLVAEDYPVYLPASASYMPPQVEITTPPDGSTFSAGDLIVFQGLVTGGTPPYSYQWTSSTDGILGDKLKITSAVGAEVKVGEVFITTVTLQVTDANGLTGTATISLNIKPLIWLPAISK